MHKKTANNIKNIDPKNDYKITFKDFFDLEPPVENAFLILNPPYNMRIAQEKNYITRRWNSVGVVIKNAFDSQALLSLNKYYCSQKKCLSCMVGKKALET